MQDGALSHLQCGSHLFSLLRSERHYCDVISRLLEGREQLLWKSRNHSSHASGAKRGSGRRASVSDALTADISSSPSASTPTKLGLRNRTGRRRSLALLSPRSAVAAGFPGEDDVLTMFAGGTLDKLVELSKTIIASLGAKEDEFTDVAEGHIVVAELLSSRDFGVFLEYAGRLEPALSCIARCRRDFPMLIKLLSELEDLATSSIISGSCGRIPLTSRLRLPLQRLHEYQQWLQGALEHSPASNRSHAPLLRAAELVGHHAEMTKQVQLTEHLRHTQVALAVRVRHQPSGFELLRPGRQLLRHGPLWLVGSHFKKSIGSSSTRKRRGSKVKVGSSRQAGDPRSDGMQPTCYAVLLTDILAVLSAPRGAPPEDPECSDDRLLDWLGHVWLGGATIEVAWEPSGGLPTTTLDSCFTIRAAGGGVTGTYCTLLAANVEEQVGWVQDLLERSRIEPIRVPTPSKPLPGSAADHGTPVRLGKIARLRLARAAASKLEQRRAVAAARKLQVGKGPTEYGDVTSPALTQDEDLIGENGGLLGALPDTDEEAAALRDQMMAEMKRLIKADMVTYCTTQISVSKDGPRLGDWAATSEWARDTGGDPEDRRAERGLWAELWHAACQSCGIPVEPDGSDGPTESIERANSEIEPAKLLELKSEPMPTNSTTAEAQYVSSTTEPPTGTTDAGMLSLRLPSLSASKLLTDDVEFSTPRVAASPPVLTTAGSSNRNTTQALLYQPLAFNGGVHSPKSSQLTDTQGAAGGPKLELTWSTDSASVLHADATGVAAMAPIESRSEGDSPETLSLPPPVPPKIQQEVLQQKKRKNSFVCCSSPRS